VCVYACAHPLILVPAVLPRHFLFHPLVFLDGGLYSGCSLFLLVFRHEGWKHNRKHAATHAHTNPHKHTHAHHRWTLRQAAPYSFPYLHLPSCPFHPFAPFITLGCFRLKPRLIHRSSLFLTKESEGESENE
jgi:hypothetical protein